MIASAAVAALACGVAWLLLRRMGPPDGELAQLVCVLGLLSAAWLLGAHLAATRRLGGTLRGHYAAGAIAATALVVASAVAGSMLMFVSRTYVEVLVAIAASSLIVGVRVAAVLADGASATLRALGAGLEQVAADGAAPGRVPEDGPTEVAAVARVANRMAADLEEARAARASADVARRELVAAASHDLRTPIAALRLIADAIADGVVSAPDEVADYQRLAQTHLRHLESLVEDLFELARIDAGDVDWHLEHVALDGVVEEAVEAFRPAAAARRIALEARVPHDLPALVGSPAKLQRVLFNLVDNAVRHTPDGGRVRVSAAADGSAVALDVEDTGPGVPADERERVFVRFHRGGAAGTARSAGGAGLGLAIARSIVEAHGGVIGVDDGELGGARFRVRLPLGQAALP